MMKALIALTALAVIATPALAKEKVRAGQYYQPTGKWCETDPGEIENTEVWRAFKRGSCKAADDEDGWIVFFPGGYREPQTTCKIVGKPKGQWQDYSCMADGDKETRSHKWLNDNGSGELLWATMSGEDDED
jgi:hypothetical protein